MAEDHGGPEAGQLSRAWTRGRRGVQRKLRVANREQIELPKSKWCKGSVAGQCRMRSEVSWDECPQVLQEGFSILPILET